MPKTIGSHEAHSRMLRALDILGTEDGDNVPTDTVLKASRKALTGFTLAFELSNAFKSTESKSEPE